MIVKRKKRRVCVEEQIPTFKAWFPSSTDSSASADAGGFVAYQASQVSQEASLRVAVVAQSLRRSSQ